MHDPLHALLPLTVLLAVGVLSATLLPRLGIPVIVGYIVAGVIVGPSVTGWVPVTDEVRLLAEFGVVFLLFDIGLHFSLKQVWAARRDFLALGPLQWLSTTAVIAAALWYFGIGTTGTSNLLLVAGALALSSTAVALQTLRERGENDTPLARSATALLIFQDLVAVVLLALAATDGSGPGADWPVALGKALLAFIAVAVVGRILRPAFARIVDTGHDEAFTAAALLVVVVTAGLTGLAGLSLPLGAFLGGMLLSESEYCYMVKTELKPFRGLLLGLFFITVGMSLDAGLLTESVGLTLAVASGLLLVKSLLIVFAAALTGSRPAVAVRLGFTLGQGSEFAFVVFALMVAAGSLGGELSAMLSAAIVLTMAATPAIAPLGDRIASALARRAVDHPAAPDAASQHVLINGVSESELTVARALIANNHRYLAMDTDRDAVVRARAHGFNAALGDLDDARLVEGLDRTPDLLIIGRRPPDAALDLVRRLRRSRPGLNTVVRVAREDDALPLRKLGATVCVAPSDPDDETLAVETLRLLGTPESRIRAWVESYRMDSTWEKADKAHAA